VKPTYPEDDTQTKTGPCKDTVKLELCSRKQQYCHWPGFYPTVEYIWEFNM